MGKKGPCMSTSSSNELIICRIMQKFRPIAPKPLSDDGKALSNGVVTSTKKTGRVKRKYSRKKKGDDCKNNTLFKKNEEFLGDKSRSKDDQVVTTLQLLPLNYESSQILKCISSSKSSVEDVQGDDQVDELSALLKCPYNFLESSSSTPGGKEGLKEKVRVAETWIIVECITGVCMEFHNLLLGLSDNEKINHLQLDLSPCFVSDNLDNVVFVNEAYKKMVIKNNILENNHKFPTELIKVELVMKERVPIWFPKAFSCTARLIEYNWWRAQPEKFSRTVPCDVWRMDIGGFAWKLDIKTALGLGL